MSIEQVEKQQVANSSPSSLDSTSNSVSLIKLDELSSFGATKQARLPALIKLNPLADQNSRLESQQVSSKSPNSMPDFSSSQQEKPMSSGPAQQSLPATLQQPTASADKENEQAADGGQKGDDSIEGFQVVDMEAQLVGPSLPAPTGGNLTLAPGQDESVPPQAGGEPLLESGRPQQYASHLGDSLIEMIINLRNENQNLVKALEVNNNYVKERLDEFKRCQEEAKRRELEHQEEKGELEHQMRKVQRQNGVLSERLKSMEQKLKDMKLEVSGTLSAAHSSKASSIQGEQGAANLYPQLADSESFSNANQPEAATMQIDANNSELYNDGDNQSSGTPAAPTSAAPMETDTEPKTLDAQEVGAMTREELSKRFDAKKVDFYALDDPMKQCDQLEQQLNDIGKRDYEICLLQQQLNIYRRDFRLERMAKLEAKMQIEKLKNEIDRLCLERLQQQQQQGGSSPDEDTNCQPAGPAGDNLIGKLGHHLSRRALKSAAKAAKYASKQAHLEEKAAAALARAAAAKASAAGFMQPQSSGAAGQFEPAGRPQEAPEHVGRRHHHRGHHHHAHHHHHAPPHPAHHKPSGRSIRGEIVSDLMSTANKAMLTGYNLASTTINSALDKLSQFEQQQAAQATDPNRPRPGVAYPNPEAAAKQQQQQAARPSAPPMDSHLSVD